MKSKFLIAYVLLVPVLGLTAFLLQKNGAYGYSLLVEGVIVLFGLAYLGVSFVTWCRKGERGGASDAKTKARFLARVRGRDVLVDELAASADAQADLLLKIRCGDERFALYCRDASPQNGQVPAAPLTVSGFTVDDRRPDGIGVPSRYHIHGAEDGGLDLFCADLSIAED